MSLITRQGKGSRLSIQDMDNNLIYLESLAQQGGGTGLGGTNYKFIKGDGTPTENGLALETAYIEAKSSTPNSNPLSNTNRMIIVVGSGQYLLSSELILDTEFIDIVSLTGNKDILLVGSNTINITASNIIVRGVDCLNKSFKITNDNLNILIDNCSGSDESFGYNQIVIGEFNNCIGGENSFGMGGTFSGILNNCELINSSFNDLNNIGGEINYSKDINGLYLIKYDIQPDTQSGFDDLTLVTKKWVEDNSASTLDEVLNLGNRTGNNDIIIDDGQKIIYEGDETFGVVDTQPIINNTDGYWSIIINDKIYVSSYDEYINIYDLDLNLLNTFNVPDGAYVMSHNTTLNRLYIGSYENLGPKWYIDTTNDTLVSVANTKDGVTDTLVFNSFNNRIFASDYFISNGIDVYDDNYEYIISYSYVNVDNFWHLDHNPINGHVYISARDTDTLMPICLIIDSNGNELDRIEVGSKATYADIVQWDTINNRIIISLNDEYSVIDFDGINYTHISDYIFFNNGGSPFLRFFDGKMIIMDRTNYIYEIDNTNSLIPIFHINPSDPFGIKSIIYYQDFYYTFTNSAMDNNFYKIGLYTTEGRLYTEPLSGNRDWQLPDKSGIIALLDDIPSINDSLYSNVYFVDPVNGNNSTGEMNNFDRPYLTIATAVNQANLMPGKTSTNRALVYVRRGLYINTINLMDNVDIYFEAGATLTNSSTIRDNAQNVNSNVYGHLNMNVTIPTGNVAISKTNANSSIYIEFDKIISSRAAIGHTIGGNLKMKGNYIYSGGANTGFGISIRGTANFDLTVRDKIEGLHSVLEFRNNEGEIIINCPNINLLIGTTVASPGNFKHCLMCYNASAGTPGKITVNGNLNVFDSTNHGGITSAVRFFGAVNYQVELNGNIQSNVIPGVVLGGNGKFIMNGNIQSNRQLIITTSDTEMELTNSKMIKNVTAVGDIVIPIIMQGNSKLYINNSTMYSEVATMTDIYLETDNNELYINNLISESPIGSEYFIANLTSSPTVGIINCASSRDISPALTPEYIVNFSIIPNIKVPKII